MMPTLQMAKVGSITPPIAFSLMLFSVSLLSMKCQKSLDLHWYCICFTCCQSNNSDSKLFACFSISQRSSYSFFWDSPDLRENYADLSCIPQYLLAHQFFPSNYPAPDVLSDGKAKTRCKNVTCNDAFASVSSFNLSISFWLNLSASTFSMFHAHLQM